MPTGQTQNSSGGIQDTQASYALAIEYNVISDENRDQAANYWIRLVNVVTIMFHIPLQPDLLEQHHCCQH